MFGFLDDEDSHSAELVPSLRVLLLGDPGVGTSTLAQYIAAPKAGDVGSPPSRDSGCSVHLKLLQYPPDRARQRGVPALSGRVFFVELWDVGAAPRHAALRPLFYAGASGAILTHSLAAPSTLASLRLWAAELVVHGSGWRAPLPPAWAALNLGGLPVPTLVCGCKADLASQHRHRQYHRQYRWGTAGCATAVARGWLDGALDRVQALLPPLLHGAARAPRAEQPQLDSDVCWSGGDAPLGFGHIATSAALGDVDMHCLNEFFLSLAERQFSPAAERGASCASGADWAWGGGAPSFERLPSVLCHPISEETSPAGSPRTCLCDGGGGWSGGALSSRGSSLCSEQRRIDDLM